MKNFKILAIALTATLFLSSCDKDDNNPAVNEEELITTVELRLGNVDGSVTLISKDLDGDGPNAPVVTVSGPLRANTTYIGFVRFLDETKTPAENRTEEIAAEAKDHQVFYRTSPTTIGTFTYSDLDNDADGKPRGLAFTLETRAAGTGNITVTLRHKLNKSASGVANGDITNAGGSTDAEVTYPVTIN